MKRKLFSLLALLMVAVTGAWADGKVYTSAVDITALQVGDILAEGASINGNGSIIFDLNRVKVNGTLQTEGFIYLYTSDFDSFGAEGVISLSNKSTISPVDKDNNDGNAWEVTNVENNNYIHIQGITYAPAPDDTTVFELSGSTATTGTLTLGTAGVEAGTLKIHDNTDQIAGIKMSSSYNLADGKYFTIAPATGSFKAGDKLSIAVCFNNTDDTKNAKAAIYAADGATLLYTTANGINGRNSADDPAVEEYVLTQDADLLYIGRNGNTATFVTTLKVVRPASSGGGSANEVYYTLDTSGSTQTTNNSYASSGTAEVDGITWTFGGNGTMNPWRIGGKSITNTDRVAYTQTAMGAAISSVDLTVGAASDITVNSLKLIVASDAAFSSLLDEVTGTFVANSTITFKPTSGESWAKDAYYKFVFNVTVSTASKNKFVEFSKVEFFKAAASSGGSSEETNDELTLSAGINDHSTMKFYVGQDEVTKAKEGETVTIVVTPDDGWSIGNVTGQWIAAMAKAPRRTAGIGLLQDVDVTFVSEDAQTRAHTYTFVMQRAKAEFSVVYKKHLDHPDITISNILPVIYNAQAHTPSFTVKDGSKVLVLGTDYTVTYSDNVMACDKDAAENAPTVTIKAVEGHNFYVGENSKTFTIRKKTLEDGFMSKVADVTYTGKAQEPVPVLTYDGMTLVEGTDYVFSYINNKDAAQATDAKAPVVTASAVKNSNFTGAASQKFNIKKAPLTVKANDVEVFYGEEPQFTVSYEGFVNEETEAVLEGTLAFACDYTKESAVGSSHDITPSGLTAKNYEITFTKGTLTVATDPAPYKESLQTAIAIASNINPEAFADAIAAAQAALTAEGATAESLVQAIQALETAIKTYFGEMLPKLGAIVEDLNEEALNTAYADAQAVLAKEGVTAQEMAAAMQNIITTAQTVAPAHLDNLRGYAVKYGAEGTAALVDSARAAIEEGNVSKIITTMTAVREAATPLATGILTQMIGYAQSYTGFEADVIEAQAVLEGGNYITMINTAKALHDKLIEAAKAYVAEAKAIPTEGKEGAAELNAAILAAEEALAGDETDFSAINTAISNLVAAVKAFKKANDEPIFIETDLTAQFPVDYQGWIGATGLVGWAAPAVTTNDGRQTAACERYEGTCGTLGDVFTRTLTGLTNGTYRIELYGAAAYTSGRGFDSELVEGDETAVYLYAETAGADASRRAGGQRVKQYIPAHVADNFNGTGIATAVLDNVVVTDGTVKLGMYKEKPYTNWHVVQIKGVTALVDGVELHANELAAAKAALNAEEYAVVTGEEKTALVTAISENATVAEQTAEGYKAAIKALSDATAAFTGAKAAYESYVAAQAYLVDLPYANAEKKPVAEAATNAADATAKAEALMVALRAYYESAALAENVAGAKVMTDAIKNPKAEDGINNWTVVKGEGSGGDIVIRDNEPWTDAAGVAEHKYFDGGNWGAQAWDVALEQKIALPAGKYLLTTIARAEKAVDFTLYAGANSVKIPAISSVGGVFNRGWNNAAVEFEMAEADSIVIGVRGVTSEIHNWMSFSDFRLVQLEGVTEIEMPEGVIYSWESPEGTPIEFGGTIAYVNGDGNRLNYLNSGNYTICLNGKKANLNDEAASANAGHMVITLDNAVAEGDTIAITGYITKNSSAKSSAWIVYENGATAESAVFGDESNIFVPEGGAATGAINTKYVIVSAEAAGSKTITLTRGQTGTNLFITKLQVISKKAEEPVETIETMYLMGDFTGGWDFQDTQKMTQDAENAAVWTLTVEAFEAEAKKYEYKATANAKWGLYELPSSGNYDFVFGTEGYPAGKYDLKFTVNTTDHTLTLEATKHIESGINTLKTAIENGNVYNMNGQRVNKAQKGLYIINGRKVVIK